MRILITFALEPELIDQIRAVAPDRIEIDVLGQDQRRLLRGFKYPSEREREAVAEGLHGAFEHADVVFGFWGTELHYALIDARAMGGNVPATIADVAPNLKWIQLTSAGADRLLNSGFIEGGITVTTVSGLHATPIGEFVRSCEIDCHVKPPRPSAIATKTCSVLWVSTLGPVVSVSTLA